MQLSSEIEGGTLSDALKINKIIPISPLEQFLNSSFNLPDYSTYKSALSPPLQSIDNPSIPNPLQNEAAQEATARFSENLLYSATKQKSTLEKLKERRILIPHLINDRITVTSATLNQIQTLTDNNTDLEILNKINAFINRKPQILSPTSNPKQELTSTSKLFKTKDKDKESNSSINKPKSKLFSNEILSGLRDTNTNLNKTYDNAVAALLTKENLKQNQKEVLGDEYGIPVFGGNFYADRDSDQEFDTTPRRIRAKAKVNNIKTSLLIDKKFSIINLEKIKKNLVTLEKMNPPLVKNPQEEKEKRDKLIQERIAEAIAARSKSEELGGKSYQRKGQTKVKLKGKVCTMLI
jgi:hypothetical protein